MATDSNHRQSMSWFYDTNSVSDMSSGLKKYRSTILNNAAVVQAVSTRDYGNMALHTGDGEQNVVKNRQRFLGSMGLELDNLVAAGQIHSAVVQVVGRLQVGSGAWSLQTALPRTDALITQERGVILSIFTADCLPIFIYDPLTPAIAIIHAGWRGSIAQIAKATIDKMIQEFKTNPGNCRAAIGPSICKDCFTVADEVAKEFYNVYPQAVSESTSGYQIDLAAFNLWLLRNAGLKSEYIENSGLCTGCHNQDFYSYRIEKGTGCRMMGIIALQ
jgi:YfiH family protein